MKQLLQSFLVQSLIFSITLMPYNSYAKKTDEERAEDFQVSNQNDAGENCTTSSQNASGMYSSGDCVAATIENAQLTTTKGYRKQNWLKIIDNAVVGMTAANLISALRYKKPHKVHPNIYADGCSMNKGRKLTPPFLAAGASAYLIGEIGANTYFRDASKSAFDEKYATDSTLDSNIAGEIDFALPQKGTQEYEDFLEEHGMTPEQKLQQDKTNQEAAYDTLISILKEQKKGMNMKLAFAYGSESAYLTALILEGLSIKKCNLKCTESQTRYKEKLTAFKTSYQLRKKQIDIKAQEHKSKLQQAKLKLTEEKTTYAADKAQCAPKCASSYLGAPVCTAACLAAEAGVHVPKIADATQDVVDKTKIDSQCKIMRQTLRQFKEKKVRDEQKGKITSKAADIKREKNFLEKITDVAGLLKKVKDVFSTSASQDKIFVEKHTKQSVEVNKTFDADETREKNSDKAQKTSIVADINTLATSDYANMQSMLTMANDCSGTKEGLKDIFKSYRKYKYELYECCGVAYKSKNTLDNAVNQIDTLINHNATSMQEDGVAFVENILDKKFSITKDLMRKNKRLDVVRLENNQKFFLKESFEYFLRSTKAKEYSNLDFSNPSFIITRIRADESKVKNLIHDYGEYLNGLDLESQKIMLGSVSNKNFLNRLGAFLLPSANASVINGVVGSLAGSALSSLSDKLNLKGPFVPLMKVGASYIMVQGYMKTYMEKMGMTTPKGRMTSMGVLTAATGAVIALDHNALKKIKNNIAFMEAEKVRFKNGQSRRIVADTEVDGGLVANGNYGINSTSNGQRKITTCLNFRNSTYVPSICSRSNKVLKLDVKEALKLVPSNMRGVLGNSISSLTTLASKSASGDFSANDFGEGSYLGLQESNGALRKYAKKLIADIDKSTGDEGKKSSISNTIKEFEKALGTRGSFSGNTTPDLVASIAPKKSSSMSSPINALKSSNKSLSSIPPSQPATSFSSGTDGLDFGDEGEDLDMLVGDDKPPLSLDSFELDHDDINKKKEVSIFKILSNRYLTTYPVFLDKK